MKTVQLREAKASLSALVDAAERGEPTMITRHGKPAAVLVSVELEAARTKTTPSFVEMLMSIPEELPFVRDRRPARAHQVLRGYILDTDVVSLFAPGRKPVSEGVKAWLTARADRLFLSTISVGEDRGRLRQVAPRRRLGPR